MTAGRGFPQSPAAATITRSPRLIVRAPIGRIELGNGLDPAQRRILTAWDETSDLRGHTPTDRGQARIGDDNSQFAQAALAPSLPHLSHPFGRGGHRGSFSCCWKRNALRLYKQENGEGYAPSAIRLDFVAAPSPSIAVSKTKRM